MGKVVVNVSSSTSKLVVDASSSINKLTVGVLPSTIVLSMGNLTMDVISSSVVPSSSVVVLSPSKVVAHDHIFHDKRVVQVDQYPSEKGFLDALNEHFDAWNAHNQLRKFLY